MRSIFLRRRFVDVIVKLENIWFPFFSHLSLCEMVRSHHTDFIHKIPAHYKRRASPLSAQLPFMNLANGI